MWSVKTLTLNVGEDTGMSLFRKKLESWCYLAKFY